MVLGLTFGMARTSGLTTKPRMPKKWAYFEERDHYEALGRSRGGYGTKVCVIADGRGGTVAFTLALGQAHELPLAPAMLDQLPR